MSVFIMSLYSYNVTLYWAYEDNIFCERKVYGEASTSAVINSLTPPCLHLLVLAFRRTACAGVRHSPLAHSPLIYDLAQWSTDGPTWVVRPVTSKYLVTDSSDFSTSFCHCLRF